MAARAEPPAAITPTAANWVAPVKTKSDIAEVIATDSPAPVATTPNEMPKTPTATPSVMQALRISPGVDGTSAVYRTAAVGRRAFRVSRSRSLLRTRSLLRSSR